MEGIADTPHFSLGWNSVTIKCVGHGWVCTYHIETRTTKEFILYEFIPLTHYYAPGEINCLFWWADHFAIRVTVSLQSRLRALSRSPRINCYLLCLLLPIVMLLSCFNFFFFSPYFPPHSFSSPRVRTFHALRNFQSVCPPITTNNTYRTGIRIPI